MKNEKHVIGLLALICVGYFTWLYFLTTAIVEKDNVKRELSLCRDSLHACQGNTNQFKPKETGLHEPGHVIFGMEQLPDDLIH